MEEVKSLSSKYYALHVRMRRRFGTPEYCVHCMCFGEGPTYNWAHKHNAPLIAHPWYFLRLCKKCHTKYDGGVWNKQSEKDPYKAWERAHVGPGKILPSYKLNLGNKGKSRPSEETKKRMSEAAKKRWAHVKGQ